MTSPIAASDRSVVSRRAALLAAATGIGTVLLPGESRAGRPALRVATFKGFDELALQTAGVVVPNVGFTEFASGNLIVEALSAQAIDFGSMSQIPVAFAAISRAKIKVIATIKADVNEQLVLVPKSSTARSVADLKGKRVGYVRATTSHYFLLKMLQQEGLSFADITAINLSPSDGHTAFAAGALDAFALYGYVAERIKQSYGARVLRTANGILSGDYLYAARPDALTDPSSRAEIEGYLRATRMANRWRSAHQDAYSAAVAQTLGLPYEIVKAVHDGESQPRRLAPIDDAVVSTTQDIVETFFQAGVLPKRADVAPLFDRSFNALLTETGG